MFVQALKPIKDKDKYSRQMAQLLAYDLFHLIYKPLLDILVPGAPLHNAPSREDIIIKAFHDRRIYWSDGFVRGKFNAALTKALMELGARFNKTSKSFKLDLAQLPPTIRAAIAAGSTKEKDAIDKLAKKVSELKPAEIVIPGAHAMATETLADLNEQFKKVTPADLEIPVDMDDATAERMRADYLESMHLNIRGWADHAVDRLRLRVAREVGQGTRAEDLKDMIMAEYATTANRAKFIARQETSLFVSKFRQVRYEKAGLDEYRWSTSNDDRVRHDHRDLNGRIFSWDNPPIVDKRTGRRANPGEDFQCRCTALPVFRVAGVDALAMPEYGEDPYGVRRNQKSLSVLLKPAEYLELVQQGFGYPTMGHLLATMIVEKVESIKDRMRQRDEEWDRPFLEYKWTGTRIIFWQDGRHRVKAGLDMGVDGIQTNVFLPDDEEAVEAAMRIMPTWFIDKLGIKDLVSA